jgi:hypothetical protein
MQAILCIPNLLRNDESVMVFHPTWPAGPGADIRQIQGRITIRFSRAAGRSRLVAHR